MEQGSALHIRTHQWCNLRVKIGKDGLHLALGFAARSYSSADTRGQHQAIENVHPSRGDPAISPQTCTSLRQVNLGRGMCFNKHSTLNVPW